MANLISELRAERSGAQRAAAPEESGRLNCIHFRAAARALNSAKMAGEVPQNAVGSEI